MDFKDNGAKGTDLGEDLVPVSVVTRVMSKQPGPLFSHCKDKEVDKMNLEAVVTG